jgi:hypothetical protein
MATEVMMETGGIGLAMDVRNVARDVRRLVLAGGGHPDAVAAVYRRIEGLREQIRDLPDGTLHRWLDGVERELEAL